MKILFLTIGVTDDLSFGGMYIDLALELSKRGHEVTLMGATSGPTSYSSTDSLEILRVHAPKIVGEKNKVKKGIAMATFSWFYYKAFKKYLKGRKYDWIFLPTPPITLIDFVKRIKYNTSSKLYLILRDIHPQAPASLNEIKYKWMCSYLYNKANKAYLEADIIGTMSQMNSDFILHEHPSISRSKFSILLNWLKNDADVLDDSNITDIRKKYDLENKVIILFGGNISLGQRIENIADLIQHFKDNDKIIFIIIGKGVMKDKLIKLTEGLNNVKFLDYMPRREYMAVSKCADIGLISINENNAAPTCPSKAVAYMNMRIPIFAMINSNSDYGQTYIDKPNSGLWAIGSNKADIYSKLEKLINNPDLRRKMGDDGYKFYMENLTVEKAADTIETQIKNQLV